MSVYTVTPVNMVIIGSRNSVKDSSGIHPLPLTFELPAVVDFKTSDIVDLTVGKNNKTSCCKYGLSYNQTKAMDYLSVCKHIIYTCHLYSS